MLIKGTLPFKKLCNKFIKKMKSKRLNQKGMKSKKRNFNFKNVYVLKIEDIFTLKKLRNTQKV